MNTTLSRNIQTIYPATPMQQGMLFHSAYTAESGIYVEQLQFTLDGAVDLDALRQAWQQLIDQNDVLRTCFVWQRTQTLQVVLKQVDLPWSHHDWQHIPDEQQQQKLQEWLQQDQQTVFDTTKAPLLRFTLITLGQHRHQFIWTYHHALLDGWSLSMLMQDLLSNYQANDPPKPHSRRPYQTYIAWLQQQDRKAVESYWQQKLSGFLTPTPLPLQARETAPASDFHECEHLLSAELTKKIQGWVRQQHVSLATLIYGAWGILLSRYSGESDVVFGITVSGRDISLNGVEEMVGLFINTLPLRVTLSPDSSGGSVIKQLQQDLQDLQGYSYIPLVDVQRLSELSHNLFNTLVIIENYPIDQALHDYRQLLPIEAVAVSERTNYPLNLGMIPGERLLLNFSYNSALFAAETIERLGSHLEILLQAIVNDSSVPVAALPMLTDQEQHLLTEWNCTAADYPRDRCIHQLFEQQVEQIPEATAVVWRDTQLTYQELNQRANQLAHHLQGLGVKSGMLVGIYVERSIEMVVGLLGILKAGGAYVPLDPNYPQERLSYVLADSAVEVLLTQQSLLKSLPQHQAQVVCLDTDWNTIKQHSFDNVDVGIGSDDLAYVIYTSGSTGKPKGVLVTHQSLVNHNNAVIAEYSLSPSDRVLQFASLSFDVALEEIFPTWLSGATLVLHPQKLSLLFADFVEFIQTQRLTVLNLPAAFWHEWTLDLSQQQVCLPSGLRLVVVGSEPVQWSRVAIWKECVGSRIKLCNAYGPTEATITTTIYSVNLSNPEDQTGCLPIGRPIANTEVYILDSNLHPVPIGVAGEIYIGGECLSKGYLDRPKLTREKFILNHFDRSNETSVSSDGARGQTSTLYKTGDLGRYLPDGNIEFIGRIDHQVKIRGFRIETGEIESILTRYPHVQQAVVTAVEEESGDKRLVAYVVPQQETQSTNQIELWPSVGEYPIYDDLLYYAMTNDHKRNKSYQSAINQLVKDKVVVEIGTGKDAILARFCAQAGARKIYAIEMGREAYQLALTCVQKLGLSEKIIIIYGDATQVELPELADVCVSEIIGTIGGSEGVAAILNNARRFLKPDGAMIPARSVTKIAAVTCPDEILRQPKFTRTGYYAEKIFDQVGYAFDVRVCVKGFPQSNLLSNQEIFEDLDFTSLVPTEFSHQINLTIDTSGRLDGFLVWLNLQTIEGECIDVLAEEYSWLPVYFPVFDPGIEVSAGDVIEAVCIRTLSENKINPDYALKGHIVKVNGECIEFEYASYYRKQLFKQIPFYQRLFADSNLEDYSLNRPSSQEDSLSDIQLRAYLQSKLPDYMVPSAFVRLDSLPLAPNGKVDRRALPVPSYDVGQTERFVAPQTERQTLIANFFAEILSMPAETIGIHDSFFDLGGHSLLAMRLLTLLRQNFDIEIPLKVLFATPTVAGIDTALEGQDAGDWDIPKITPMSRDDTPIPLSYAQERLWFLAQLEGMSATYNMPGAVRVEGHFDVATLQQAINEMVRRHGTLRTTFPLVNGTAVQHVHATMEISLAVLDISELTVSLEEWLTHEVQQPFDLAAGPLLRVSLVRLKRDAAALVVTMHHIISDGWSMGIFIRELIALYGADEADQPLPVLPIQYSDYALWQRQWLQGEVLDAQLSYWRQQLTDIPTLLELPTDHPRPAVQSFRGSTQVIPLPTVLSEQVKALARQHQVTLFMTLLTAFQILLYRYSNQPDIVVGTSIANRQQPELEELIGLFVNTLVLRTRINPNDSVKGLLQRVKQMTLEGYSHKDVPFEQVVEALQPQRSLAHSPLFQVMFMLQNIPQASMELPNMTVTPLMAESVSAKFDLTLSVEETDQGLVGQWGYNTDLFEPETIIRMANHFEVLLTAMVTDDSQAVATMPLLTPAEQQQILIDWNNTATDYPHAQSCLHELIESQVERTPEAIAVVCGQEQINYQNLNEKANQLAHHLQELGVGPDSLVGICVERSIDMVVGLLGILKAGGAYLPLDPQIPQTRLMTVVADSNLSILLTQQSLAKQVVDLEVELIYLDTDWSKLSSRPCHNLASVAVPDNLAYVIYTSGSTGQPKGVAVGHRALVNYVYSISDRLDWSTCNDFLLAQSIAFDFSKTILWSSLCWGKCLHLLSEDSAIDAARFANYLRDNTIDVLKITYSHLSTLQSSIANPAELLPRQRLILGGEASPATWVSTLQGLSHECEIFNHYGPTETTVGVLTYHCADAVDDSGSLPVGRPLANSQAYILDAQLQMVPMGVSGELHIGGIQMACGYLNRPDLTAEKFIANPFGDGHLYKTGDLVRYRPDGTIAYLGRIDHQVKIRGFRIELGEIEAALTQHAQISAGVVLMQENDLGDQRLVAYVISDGEISGEDLKTELKQRLPDYMVPMVIVPLDEIPLMPNGKIDRKALPAPVFRATEKFIAPQTERQTLIASLFAEVLSVPAETLGIYDDFFDLGGHSLLAMRLITSLRQAFETEIPLKVLFETPTVAGVDVALEMKGSGGLSIPQVTPAPRDSTPIPLSYAQERLWFLAQLEGTTATYNMPSAVRVEGVFDLAMLQQAINAMVRRHEVLRTTFPVVNGTAVQHIHSAMAIPLQVVEASELKVSASDWLSHEAQQPFDLATGPLLRLALIRIEADVAILMVTIHHIISDGWSISIFIRELIALYRNDSEAKPLSTLPIQYADYAQWQRQWLQGAVLATQLDYWRQQLAGAPTLLELPTDHPRPAVQSFRGQTQVVTLPEALSEQVKALARKHQVTLFMTLLTAFQVLLYRYSKQPDIVVGSSIANRQQADLESLIGLFVNTLVLRSHINETDSVSDLLRQVKQMTLDAYSHKDVPFEQVVEALQPQRSLAHSPLFQVMFMLQNMPRSPLELPDMTVTPLPAESVVAKFDLILSVEESDQGLACHWEYSTDLFEPETIGRMASHFEVLLTAMVADDSQAIATMPLLTSAEQQQFAEWNATAAPYPDLCLHTLIDRQAKQTPEAVAVAFEADQLTYQELNTKADGLAHYLQSMGIGPDSLVGICVERSVDMMVGLLGILKAGGAYIPLDPNYPQQRLAFMVEDANVKLLISQSWLLDLLPHYHGETVCLDQPIPAAAAPPSTASHSADTLAYMIYTSGSTGRPKGVQITHNAVVDLIHSQRQDLGITQADTILSAASFSFDMSVLELWLPLVVGAQLVLVSREVAQDGLRLAEQINTRGVTLMQATPATWRMLLDANWSGSSQLQIICGGEALTPDLAKALRERCATLRNFYGPTEVTVWATQQDITDSTPITVGRPLTNTQTYLLDEWLNPVPVGVPGELYLGGVRLSRGYYKRPSLTAERFIPNPFGQTLGDRLYRTGDLARYLPDGTIDYLGRADYQVKLRGFRIELGEIEAVLDRHEQVRQCTVMIHKDTADQERLVAYIVSDTDAQHLKQQLKQHLRQHLPDYMVPNVVMCLPTLPLTPNGKVDRKALPEPDYERTTEFVAPQTEAQKLIAALFTKVLTLPVEQVGIYDNFFELGGHSLLATQVIARMRQIFHVNISVRQLFETPTVAELAAWLREQRQAQQDAIPRVDRNQPLPLSFAQERLWFLEQLYPDSAAYNQTVAVRLTGNLHIDALHQSLQTIVDRHESLRTTFILHQGQPVQHIASTLTTTLPVVDLRSLPSDQHLEELQRLATAANQENFDITQGPLFRASILRLQDQEYILIWTIHHIISDMWSTGVLVHELSTLYTAYTTASLPLLESLPIQYADFAVWQRQWLTDEVLDQQLAYWRQKLGGQLPVLNLPADYPPSETPSFRGDMATFHLSADLASKLHQLSQANSATLFMTLLAGFKTLLYAYSGQPDMMVGTDIANRNRTEIEGLIGFFINLLVLRTDLSGNPSFQDLLQRVREVTLESYAHQDLPFSQLVQALQPDTRRSGATPFVQALFVMQNAPFTSFELPELTLTPVEIDTHSARFDLALFVGETPTGITVAWNYSTDRFSKDTISRLAQQFEALLSQIVTQPDSSLETLTSMITPQQLGTKGSKRRKKFKRVTPQAVQHSATDLVTFQPLPCGVMTVQPNNSDVNLALWAKDERAALNERLLKHGALLFRGFSIASAKDFEQAAEGICPDLFGEYGDLPRTGVSDKVYGSTPYPEDKAILFHNESSHLQQWPMKIWFCCLQPAQQGGATPIVDCRKVYQLLSPEIRDRLHQKQLMYVRNYIKGLDVAWQDFFHTHDRAVVEHRCQAAGVEWEWLADDGLRTRQIRPAVARHPQTGEWVVFNQLQLHHLSYLDQPTQQSLLSLFGEDRLPRQVYYGDGSAIEPEVLDALQTAYTKAEQVFDWHPGDIVMLDNMLMAHGRQAYVGPRQIAVAMGEIMTQATLSQSNPPTPAEP